MERNKQDAFNCFRLTAHGRMEGVMGKKVNINQAFFTPPEGSWAPFDSDTLISHYSFISLSASVKLNLSAAINHFTYTSDPQMFLLFSLPVAASAEDGLTLR